MKTALIVVCAIIAYFAIVTPITILLLRNVRRSHRAQDMARLRFAETRSTEARQDGEEIPSSAPADEASA